MKFVYTFIIYQLFLWISILFDYFSLYWSGPSFFSKNSWLLTLIYHKFLECLKIVSSLFLMTLTSKRIWVIKRSPCFRPSWQFWPFKSDTQVGEMMGDRGVSLNHLNNNTNNWYSLGICRISGLPDIHGILWNLKFGSRRDMISVHRYIYKYLAEILPKYTSFTIALIRSSGSPTISVPLRKTSMVSLQSFSSVAPASRRNCLAICHPFRLPRFSENILSTTFFTRPTRGRGPRLYPSSQLGCSHQ